MENWTTTYVGYFLNGGNTTYYDDIFQDVGDLFQVDYQKWILSLIGCTLVGLSGIFPLLFIPIPSSSSTMTNSNNHNHVVSNHTSTSETGGITAKPLKRLLSFAVGSLLGDVFLHLLPETWQCTRAAGATDQQTMMILGFWILAGLVCFIVCEMLIAEDVNSISSGPSQKEIAGYLNLVANGFDNFAHGLAVAGSFIISPRIGVLTTGAILLHEIPHEIGDFAILLRSGFGPWEAAKAQLSTATIGILGAVITLSVDCMKTMGNMTWWILPFTAGGFINIAMTNLLPDLLNEEDPKEAFKMLASLLMGIAVMALVTVLSEE